MVKRSRVLGNFYTVVEGRQRRRSDSISWDGLSENHGFIAEGGIMTPEKHTEDQDTEQKLQSLHLSS